MKAIIIENGSITHRSQELSDIHAVARWASVQGVIGHDIHSLENLVHYGKGDHLVTNEHSGEVATLRVVA